MATNVLDTMVGDILPHVRIKKIIVEEDTPTFQAPAPGVRVYNRVNTGEKKITLQMELYQRKDSLLTNSWLADVDLNLTDDGITSIFDCFNLNIITLQSNRGLSYMRKSSPLTKIQGEYSIFMKNQLAYAENWGGTKIPARNLDYWSIIGGYNPTSGKIYGMGEGQKAKGDPFACLKRTPLHLSGLVGMSQTGFGGNPGIDIGPGKVREEIYKGDVYYAIPYEYSFSWKSKLTSEELSDRLNVVPPSATGLEAEIINNNNKKWTNLVDKDENGNYIAPNLGVIVYASLNLSNVIDIPAGASKWKDSLDMEGPPSAEIILRGDKVASTREAFIDNDGREWSGPVHYHGPTTADGQVAGAPSADGYVGYMAGSNHHAGTNQAKLSVIQAPNGLVHDNVDPINQKIPDEMFVTKPDGTVVITGVSATSNVLPAYQEIEEELALIGGTLGVKYQKATIKDIYKDKKDNDNEYSSLYLTRSKDNAAHGMFYIDFHNLLMNNSYYLGFLNRGATQHSFYIKQILNYSKIIDLKIKRKRIEPSSYRNGYKCFADRSAYQEPTRVLACLKDTDAFKSYKTTYKIDEATFSEIGLNTKNADTTRYFTFSDNEVSSFTSGEYQYEVELEFYDGTPIFIRKHLKLYKEIRQQLDAYYKLASSSVPTKVLSETTISKATGQIGDEKHTKKSLYVPYYDNNYKSFRPEFSKLAYDDAGVGNFHDDNKAPVWVKAPAHIMNYMKLFSTIESYADLGPMAAKYTKLLYPGPAVNGSPEGILLVGKLYDNMISQLNKLLNSAKKKKNNNSNSLQDKTTISDDQALPESFYIGKLCSTQGIINESHTFDHPREIFKATANKNYYVDFLSLGNELFSSYGGIRILTKPYFSNRCLADLAKYTTYALADPLLLSGQSQGKNDGGVIAPVAFATQGLGATKKTKNKDGSYDVLSNQMYSYLTPSIIELSDSSKQGTSFNFRYKAFSDQIQNVLAGTTGASTTSIYGPNYFNSNLMNSVLISLANFVKNKNDLGYADLSDSYAKASDLTSPAAYEGAKIPVNQREAYKSYFSKYNITVHDLGKHNFFFGHGSVEEPGAVRGLEHDPPDYDKITSDYYSDGMTIPNDFFRDFISSNKQSELDIPEGAITAESVWEEDYPNVYKLFFVNSRFEKHGLNPNFMRPLMQDMFETSSPQNNALKFFNFNMVAAIEKFTGHGVGDPTDGQQSMLAMADKWTLLQAEDLSSSQTLFCRVKYWRPRFLHSIEDFPIVDRYFMLTNNPEEASVPPPVPLPEVDLLGSLPSMLAFFEAQNQAMLQDMMVTLTKGMTNLGVLDMPQTGPDPSPISLPGADMLTGNAAIAGGMQQMQQGTLLSDEAQDSMNQMGQGGSGGEPGAGGDY